MKIILFKLLKFSTKTLWRTGISRFPGVILMFKLVYNFSKPKGIVLINCQGNKMYVNTEDSGIAPSLLTRGVYEPFETELIKKILIENMTVVNIGANIGYYTLIAASMVGPNGKVIAFEPEPRNYKLLVENIDKNGYRNVIPIQAAVSDKQGILKFFLSESNLGASSLAEKNIAKKGGFIEVETNLLDNFLSNYTKDCKVDLIQVDAEGSEGLILDGASETISKNDKLKIVMEFWPYALNNVGTDALGLLRKIEKYGFKIGMIDEKNNCITSLIPEKIVEMCTNSRNGHGRVNLLLEK